MERFIPARRGHAPLLLRTAAACAAALATASAAPAAMAGELVVNGGLETNGGVGSSVFDGWTTAVQPGSLGGFRVQGGTVSPTAHLAVQAPPQGVAAAMSDQQGPSSQVLYQDVALPAGRPAKLSLRLFVLNQSDDFAAPSTLDYTTVPNQQARVDVMSPAAPVFDLGAGVLQNVFRTQPGDPALQNYSTVTADLSAFAGQTVRLRFAEVDNLHGLNLGVDRVSIQTGTLTATSYSDLPASGAAAGTVVASFSGSAGCSYDSASYLPAPSPAASPPGIAFPYGLFDFSIVGCVSSPASPASITMTLSYPTTALPGTQYWKYGPTSDNVAPHWYVMPATISGNTVSFTIVDGQLGDDDLTVNGTIADAGGAGVLAGVLDAKAIPTLSGTALALLGALLGLAGWAFGRRRTASVG